MNYNRLDILIEQLKNEGEDPFLLYGIAMEYISTDITKALGYLKSTRSKYPDYLPTYYQLGILLEQMDEIEECIKVLKEGVNIAKLQGNQKILLELNNFVTNLELED